MFRNIYFSLAFLISSTTTPLAQPAAEAIMQAGRICEPHFWRATLEYNSTAYNQRLQKAAWLICSDEMTSISEAENSGINLKAPINGVPIEAMFSENEATRQDARKKICDAGFEDIKELSIQKIMSNQTAPEVHEAYNKCVSTVLSGGDDDNKMLLCALSPGPTPLTVYADVIYHPKLQIDNPHIVDAPIVGGIVKSRPMSEEEIKAIIDASDIEVTVEEVLNPKTVDHYHAARALGIIVNAYGPFFKAERTLPVLGELAIGSHSFIIERDSEHGAVGISVQADNGLSCSASLEAEHEITVTVNISPEGQNITATNQTFHYSQAKGCDRNLTFSERSFCLPEGTKILDTKSHIISANCGSRLVDVTPIGNEGSCRKANFVLRGCGQNSTGCKGRGFIEFWIEALGERAGIIEGLTNFSSTRTFSSLASAIFSYPRGLEDGDLKENGEEIVDVKITGWTFRVIIDYFAWDPVSRVVKEQRIELDQDVKSLGDFAVAGKASEDLQSFTVTLLGPAVPPSDKEILMEILTQGTGAEAAIEAPMNLEALAGAERVTNPGPPGWLDNSGIDSIFDLNKEETLQRVMNAYRQGEFDVAN